MAEPQAVPSGAEIPLDSDYYRVSVEGGGDFRWALCEVGGSSESTRCGRQGLGVGASEARGRELLAQLPQKPKRDLAALRRVEAETLEAVERERQRLAERREPIRTRSEVVQLDSLDSEER